MQTNTYRKKWRANLWFDVALVAGIYLCTAVVVTMSYHLTASMAQHAVFESRSPQRAAAPSRPQPIAIRMQRREWESPTIEPFPAGHPAAPSSSAWQESSSASSAHSVPVPRASQSSTAPVFSPPSRSSDTSVSSTPSGLSQSSLAFPAFGNAVFPVSKVPNWGAMHTPRQWNRAYKEMTARDFVPVPAYDLQVLTTPMSDFTQVINAETTLRITEKLTYSTHYFSTYDVDASEFTGIHPGVDIKLALGTPLGAIAGGRVTSVANDPQGLGLNVIIEHRTDAGETFYSIYGHLGAAGVKAGDDVTSGQYIGNVGMTGNSTGPHLHLQVDRGEPGENHLPYLPSTLPSRTEAAKWVVHPITFIALY